MAKELPYFKFEPNAWENGNIQMLSREDKGLFIDICSMYWSRLGELPEKLVIQKLCGGNTNALNLLCEENIIELIEGNIYIKFLTIQLSEFENKSGQNSKNAKEGWEKRRKQKEESKRNANALNTQSEIDAIREEDIKEDKKKEGNDIPPTAFSMYRSLLYLGAEKQLINDWLKVRKTKKATNTKTALYGFIRQVEKSNKDLNSILKICIENSWSGFKVSWLENLPKSESKIIPGETHEEKIRREYVERMTGKNKY